VTTQVPSIVYNEFYVASTGDMLELVRGVVRHNFISALRIRPKEGQEHSLFSTR
jgi:hypothetical protein